MKIVGVAAKADYTEIMDLQSTQENRLAIPERAVAVTVSATLDAMLFRRPYLFTLGGRSSGYARACETGSSRRTNGTTSDIVVCFTTMMSMRQFRFDK